MRTKNIVSLLFSISVILILGNNCTQKENEPLGSQLISVELTDGPIYLSNLFDTIKPIFFETNDSSLIGADPNVIFTDKSIFIKSDNTVKIYDYTGKYLNNIDKKGNGIGEYTTISDFCINEKSNQVDILDKRQKKILSYDFNGAYIDSKPINIWAIRIFRDDLSRLYIYSGNERDNDNIYKFNVIDDTSKYYFSGIDKKKSEFLHISNPINFFKSKNAETLFFEPFNDTIYALKKNMIVPKYTISYNGQNVPESFYKKNNFSNVFEFFQEFHKHEYINSTYNVIEMNSKMLFYCLKGAKKYLVVYDKKNKKAHSYDRIIDDLFSDGAEIPFQNEEFKFFARNNTGMFFIEPAWFINNGNKIKGSEYNTFIQKLTEEDNPVGILFSIN
ncbi:6-bladed beta-propeller [Proteiniphilum saccharofermentans]|uniref:6-bladed beta-propeller n=1 Tax=Proteiniphilum saccharofermentans TaxID=1642647 RepID=UPI0028A6F184|nr:6-bladed beta-propeller [Proteiniphilum saccharofermentans]